MMSKLYGSSPFRIFTIALVILVPAWMFPGWMLFPISAALASAIAALGISVLMRTANVTFGQSLPYCIGAYCAGLVPNVFGFNELFVDVLLGGLAGGAISALLGVFMTRFSGIFFAMLSLAFSMVAYGLLAKNQALGGTDGFVIKAPTLFFQKFEANDLTVAMFLATVLISWLILVGTQWVIKSRIGLVALAIGKNDLRVTYLGGNVKAINWIMFSYCGVLAGIGGALIAALSGHVSPEYAYWTKSGDLLLIAILGGVSSPSLIFVAALLIEGFRSVASSSFPYTWQAVLGVMLLAIILFFPNGLGTVLRRSPKKIGEKDEQ